MATATHGDENWEEPTGTAYRVPRTAASDPAAVRLRRLDRLSWVLDRAIPIGRYRIGLDPIIGLLPGLGDWIGAMLSVYILYEGARLGAPGGILLRMTGNILIETVIGEIPLLGDLFDFAWQANTRNVALIHRHHGPTWRPRPLRAVWVAVTVVAFLVLTVAVGLTVLLFHLVMNFEGFRW